LQSWDKDQLEPPLKIAVKDAKGNTPMSLAFLRGHTEVFKAILDIAMAQYEPETKEKKHFMMESGDAEDSEYSCNSDDDDDDDSEPRIVGKLVDKAFTIENIGQVSMRVKSRTSPLDMLLWSVLTFKVENMQEISQSSLLRFVMKNDDEAGLKLLLDRGMHFAAQNLAEQDEESSQVFNFPDAEFRWAVENGKVRMLTEIISKTGAGIPVDHLVKKSGVEVKQKRQYYQGLTVYGKKRYVKDAEDGYILENILTDPKAERIGPMLDATWSSSLPD
jgi:hypothetical protein